MAAGAVVVGAVAVVDVGGRVRAVIGCQLVHGDVQHHGLGARSVRIARGPHALCADVIAVAADQRVGT